MPDNNSPWGNKGGGGKKPGQNPWGSQGKPDRNRPKPGEGSPDLDNVIQGFKNRVRSGGPRWPSRRRRKSQQPASKIWALWHCGRHWPVFSFGDNHLHGRPTRRGRGSTFW